MININENNKLSQNKHLKRKSNFISNHIKDIFKVECYKKTLFYKISQIIIISFLLMLFSFNKLETFVKKSSYKYLEQNFDSKNIAFNKSINFIKKCLSTEIYKFSNNFKNDIPKISIVIPLFNCENFILRAIRSIQLQNVTDFEIILIDDNSQDNTSILIEKIKNEDNRIKIIKNQKNMGVLFSRSIGVLSSKGKYLYTLDNDDMFLNEDIFDTITNISENGNFDIVEFKAISNRILNHDLLNNKIRDSIFSHQQPFILYQPQLGRYPIATGNHTGAYGYNDIFLWGKCIRTQIYKKALNIYGYDRYSRFMIRYEDILTNYMICNIAESFLFIPKYAIYHVVRKGSGADIGRKKVSRRNNILYLIDVAIDFSLNNIYNKKLPAYIMIYLLKLGRIKQLLTKNKYNMELFISSLKRIINCKYISDDYKKEIMNLIENIKFIKLEISKLI